MCYCARVKGDDLAGRRICARAVCRPAHDARVYNARGASYVHEGTRALFRERACTCTREKGREEGARGMEGVRDRWRLYLDMGS